MVTTQRLQRIIELVDKAGFVSVTDLAKACNVTEVTIRRDLQRLDQEGRLRRTHGGAAALRLPELPVSEEEPARASLEGLLTGRVNAWIATPVDPRFDRSLQDRAEKGNIPIIAESLEMGGAHTVVAVDNREAGMALGRWAGQYVQQHFAGQARVLDLTFAQSNTEMRSQAFLAGLHSIAPNTRLVLSINARSRRQVAYQLTADALAVYPEINVIFAINDASASGALLACQERGVDPSTMLLLTFGLEGDTLKNALVSGGHCRAGLAMFPEIVGPVCIEAAIATYNHEPLPRNLVTPHVILTPETLSQFYTKTPTGWKINWETVRSRLSIPLNINTVRPQAREGRSLPARLGFVVPFMEHEWYQSLIVNMRDYAASLGIGLEVVDAERLVSDDVDLRQHQIARAAAELVQPGDVLLIDGGQITAYLAEELVRQNRTDLTVITNSIPVFEILRDRPGITLMSTGGVMRRASDTLVGPTAEAALRELRANKLFLVVAGLTPGFGLSHTNPGEVAIKQAMIHAAREVILLADHTVFGQDSLMQIGPATLAHKVVTDNALFAGHRLELSKLGIEVIIAPT